MYVTQFYISILHDVRNSTALNQSSCIINLHKDEKRIIRFYINYVISYVGFMIRYKKSQQIWSAFVKSPRKHDWRSHESGSVWSISPYTRQITVSTTFCWPDWPQPPAAWCNVIKPIRRLKYFPLSNLNFTIKLWSEAIAFYWKLFIDFQLLSDATELLQIFNTVSAVDL